MSSFIKVKTIGEGGKFNVLVRTDSIVSIIEGKKGCQMLLPGGDFLPIVENFADVEKKIEMAISGTVLVAE